MLNHSLRRLPVHIYQKSTVYFRLYSIRSVSTTKSLLFKPSVDVNTMNPDTIFTTQKETTFQHQESLPSLPVPPLEQTLNKYLDSVRPHVNEEEYGKTEAIVRKFQNGVGKELHEKLMSRSNHQRNWLEKWWDDKAYLELRIPTGILVNVSGPTPFSSIWPAQEGTQIQRAALWTYYMVKYWEHLRKERLRPDRANKGTVMSMNQYKKAFNTCRIPGLHRDQLMCHFKTEKEGECPTHVAVLCSGRVFSFDTFHTTGTQLTAPELELQFSHIQSVCDDQPPGYGVGALTGGDRTAWAKSRSRLISYHPDNWTSLRTIESAAFVVVLDEESPSGPSQLLQRSLAGNSTDRWLDKSFSCIVYRNGLTAANCDHTPFEGVILVSCLYYGSHCLQHCDGKWTGTRTVRELPKPNEVMFHLDQQVLQDIQRSKLVYQALADNIELRDCEFRDYGKRFLRENKLHPDTHVQLAVQYAYYKTYRRPAPTYETATTRRFYNGRTETMRSCTMEALTWSKAMTDPSTSTASRLGLYLKAANKHNTLMAEAQNNQGCDRHLFGLYCLAEEDGVPVPEIFTDPSYTKSGGGGNFILSTSFLGYTPVHGGVAPMCENGYLVAYSIQDDMLTTVVTSWISDKDTSCDTFTDTIHNCLREMGSLIQQQGTLARL